MKRTIAIVFCNAVVLAIGFQMLRVNATTTPPSAVENGDVNGDSLRDISDAIYLLTWLFQGGSPPVAIATQPEVLDRIAALEARSVVFDSRIGAVETTASDADSERALLAGQVAALEQTSLDSSNFALLQDVLPHLSAEELPVNGSGDTARTIRFTGVNVQVVNGLGATNGNELDPFTADPDMTSVDGTGNLIVGYLGSRIADNGFDDRSGSHNLVVGDLHNFSSYGGFVSGQANTISGPYSAVSGGSFSSALARATGLVGTCNEQARDECTPTVEALSVRGMTFDSNERVLYAILARNRIVSFSDSVPGGAYEGPEVPPSRGLCFDSNTDTFYSTMGGRGLVVVDVDTGEHTIVGDAPDVQIRDVRSLAFNPNGNVIYAAAFPNSGGAAPSNIYTIDPTTGRRIDSQRIDTDRNPVDPPSIAYDPAGGRLYIFFSRIGLEGLSILNPTTGGLTFVGRPARWVRGMAFDSESDTLYGLDGETTAILRTLQH